MYSAKPLFNMPANEHTTIWRYMDFTKFVSLLDKKALYFSRPDKLSDKFEGAIPRPTVMARKTLVSGSPIAEDTLKVMSQGAQEVRKFVFLNCWHMNNNESAAMWQLYVQKNEGVAIRSTFARLRESLSSSLFEVFIGMVNYIDYERIMIPEGNALHAFFCKRQSFEHERELRAAICSPSEGNRLNPGLYVPCDLNTLIDTIFVSPESPNWFKELVTSVLDKYSLDKEVKRSNLDEAPLY